MSLDFTKPVQTRDGRKVRILATDFKHGYPIVGVVQQGNGDESLVTWTLNGDIDVTLSVNPYDLVQAPEWVSTYIGVYGNVTDPKSIFTDDEHLTLESATYNADKKGLTHVMKLSVCPGHEPKVEFIPVAEKE